MAKSNARYFPQVLRKPNPVSVTNTAAPGDVAISSVSGEPTEVVSLVFTGDSSDRTIEVRMAKTAGGGNPIVLWTGTLVANAGLGVNNPALDLIRENRLAGLEEVRPGKFVFVLPDTWSLYVRTTAAPTVSVLCLAYGKDYAV